MKNLSKVSVIASAVMVMSLFQSCNKEEAIKPKENSKYTLEVSVNDANGKETTDRGGNVINQFYYSSQSFLELNKNENIVVTKNVNSKDEYVNFALPVNPNSDLTKQTEAPGEWDIVFTQYSTEDEYLEGAEKKYESITPVGVLINAKRNIEVAKIENELYNTINLETAKFSDFKTNIDAIGYGWKYFDRNEMKFSLIENNYYIIKKSENEIYKLKFFSFYKDGEKGNITCELQLLN
ncbi:MAG: hypothetical protein KAG96_03360 [Ichthyobacteriaceae bacterium]|nr:hypothetical protein [Ichthyobacteriaceae bacterium]